MDINSKETFDEKQTHTFQAVTIASELVELSVKHVMDDVVWNGSRSWLSISKIMLTIFSKNLKTYRMMFWEIAGPNVHFRNKTTSFIQSTTIQNKK